MKELTVEAAIKNVAAVTNFVNEELSRLHCTDKSRMKIDIAIDELIGNIANYAYAPSKGYVTVRFEYSPEITSAIITFIDGGAAYNPLNNKDPNVAVPASQRDGGGLGIYIVKKFMDEVSYNYKDGENILRIVKKINE